jgi:hypothetical protein
MSLSHPTWLNTTWAARASMNVRFSICFALSSQMLNWSRISLLLAQFFRQSAQSFSHMIRSGFWLEVSKLSNHLGDSVASHSR